MRNSQKLIHNHNILTPPTNEKSHLNDGPNPMEKKRPFFDELLELLAWSTGLTLKGRNSGSWTRQAILKRMTPDEKFEQEEC